MAATKTQKSLYSVHPGVAMMQKWIKELPAKTGRSLDEWIELTENPACPRKNSAANG